VTADQGPPCPCARRAHSVFVGFKVGEFEKGPAVKALNLRAFARRQAMPCARIEFARDLRGGSATTGLSLHEPKRWSPLTPSTCPLPARRNACSISPTP
jgi:hypothetical protein